MKEEKLPTIKIGGREIPLFYSTYEMIQMQEDIGCTAYQLNDEVFGIHHEDGDDNSPVRFEVLTDMEKTKKLGTLIRILGNAGLEEEGKDPDLTDKWVLRHLKPGMIMVYVIALIAVITEGNKFESTTPEEEKGPVDEGLKEQNAKKQPGN
jgi:hypothetical protein